MGCSRGRKDPESLILSVNGSPFLQKAEPNKGNVEDCSMHDPAAPTMNKKFQTRKILRVEHHPLGIFFVCSKLTTEQNYPWEYLRGASRNLFTKGILAGLRPGRRPGTRRGQVGAARQGRRSRRKAEATSERLPLLCRVILLRCARARSFPQTNGQV